MWVTVTDVKRSEKRCDDLCEEEEEVNKPNSHAKMERWRDKERERSGRHCEKT